MSQITTLEAPLAVGQKRARARQSVELVWMVPVVCMTVAIILVAEILARVNNTSALGMIGPYGLKALRTFPQVIGVFLMVQLGLAIRAQPSNPVGALKARMVDKFGDPWLFTAHLAPLLLMPFMFAGFSLLKQLMPHYVPFWLDGPFAAMDKSLFFGYQPWEITHQLFSSPFATHFIDKLYTSWVLLLSVVIIGVALFARRETRARFFLSFMGAWLILGVFGAWLGSSAGPCYTADLGLPVAAEFSGLMQRLNGFAQGPYGVPGTLGWQRLLWDAHTSGEYAYGMGISAMPSLHNAIAVLYALAAFRANRWIGGLISLYAVMIWIGSIHLGWHYAVDGIFAAIIMGGIWMWADRYCKRSGYDQAVKASQA